MSKADLTTTYLFAFEKGKESAQAEIKEAKKEAYKDIAAWIDQHLRANDCYGACRRELTEYLLGKIV